MIQRRVNSEQDFINQVDKISQDSTTPPQEVAKKAKKVANIFHIPYR